MVKSNLLNQIIGLLLENRAAILVLSMLLTRFLLTLGDDESVSERIPMNELVNITKFLIVSIYHFLTIRIYVLFPGLMILRMKKSLRNF